jgi:hypothetical protein
MKKLLLSALFLPFAGTAGLRGNATYGIATSNPNSVEIRSGEWPMNMERTVDRSGVTYSLIFRNQQEEKEVILDTLVFPNLQQLNYFGQALTALKAGNNGDIANFKTYTLKRADKKFDGVWYILRAAYGITDFRQTEADLMNKTIKSW